MGGFNLNIPLSFGGITITPQQIQDAVAAQNAQPAQTLTEAVAAMPATTPTPAAQPTTAVPIGATGLAAQELTGDPDMDRMILADRDAQGVSIDVGAGSLTPEEYQQATEELEAWRNLPENVEYRHTVRPELAALAAGGLSLLVPAVAAGIGTTAGLGAVGTTLTGAGLGAGTAAVTGQDPLLGAVAGGLGTAIGGIDLASEAPGLMSALNTPQQALLNQGMTGVAALGAAGPSVVEQVFSDADYRAGGVIPEQPFETQEPVVQPTQQQGGGGGGAAAAAPDQPLEPVPPTITVDEIVDVLGGGVLADTTAPELPGPDEAQPEPAPVPDYTDAINNILTQVDTYRQEGQTSTEAVQTAVDAVAEDLNVTREDLLGQLGATEESILSDIAARDETLRGEIDATRTDIMDQVAANEEAGMARDDALQEAIDAVAAANNTTREDLLGQLGATEETLAGQIETLGETAATERQAILDEVRANEAAGMERNDALQAAIDAVADANNTTREDLLAEIGTSQEAILTEMNTQLEGITGSIEGLQGGVTRNEELIGAVNDRLAEYEAAGQTRADALEQAVADVAAQTDQSFMDVLGYLGDLQESVNVDVENVRVAGEEGRQAILDQVVANEAAGMERDAALDEAIAGVADSLGVAVEDLLSQMGTNRTELEGAIGTLEQTVADVQTNVLDQVAANEQAGMDRDAALETAVNKVSEELGVTREELLGELGATEETLSGRIGELQTSVEQQVADAQASVLEQVAANEQAGMARDEAINQAVEQVAGDLGTTRQELLDQLGMSEANILEQVAAGAAAGQARDQAIGEALGQMGTELGTGLMSLQAQARAYKPKWTDLFQYTTLTPYQKKAMAPFVDYIAKGRGMLS